MCNLYWNQTAKVKIEENVTEEIQIRHEVRETYPITITV